MKTKFPMTSTGGDAAYAAIRAALGSLPVAGAAAAELMQFIVQPPLTRRRDEFLARLADRVASLEEEGIASEHLSKNEAFVSAVMQATVAAMKTHQEAKRRALLNAVMSVARDPSIADTVQAMFFQFLDALTPDHLLLLDLFAQPVMPLQQPRVESRIWSEVVESELPHLRGGDLDLWIPILADLQAKGLVYVTDMGGGPAAPIATGLGRQFLAFISDSREQAFASQ